MVFKPRRDGRAIAVVCRLLVPTTQPVAHYAWPDLSGWECSKVFKPRRDRAAIRFVCLLSENRTNGFVVGLHR